MSFRARLTLAAALAVAIAVLLAAAVAYLAVRANLYGEIDGSLQTRSEFIASVPFVAGGSSPANLPPVFEGGLPSPPLGDAAGYAQVVFPDGTALRPTGGTVALPVDDRTLAVARGEAGAFFSTTTIEGVHVRILTSEVIDGWALQLARPLTEADSTLDRLLVFLGGVAAAGVGLAALLGALVARTAVAPLRRLREATAHVVSTSDLSRRIEMAGRDELGRLAGDFNTMMDVLEASQLAQRQLVADASHELRTPLTSLRTNIDVLVRNPMPPAERDSLLADVQAQLEELTHLIGDLIELARDTQPEQAREEVRLDLLVSEAVERASRHSPTVRFATEFEPCLVEGSPARIDRAVANLLDNAAKWSPPGGTVEVSVRAGRVGVRDHGPGIAEADLPYVFDRFYRAPAARDLPGSGLGLAIVRQVAESHGGLACAANAPGGGARLELRLLEIS